MTEVVFDEVLRMARRCKHVVLAGYGEPLTNRQCIPMLRALDAEGIVVGMATNGIALTPKVARQLVELQHLELINVSIDSPDPDVYREVRGGNVLRALQGLRNLMAVIDDPRRVMVSSVAMQTNLPTLAGFPALLAEMGVRRYSLQAVMDYNDYSQQQRLLDHVEHEAVLRDIEAACVTHGIDLELSVPERSHADFDDTAWARERFYGFGEWDEHLTRQCNVPWDIPFVDKDGRVFPCCFAASANESQLGQIGPQTFDEAWNSDAFRQFRWDIVDGRSTPKICRRCTVAPLGPHLFRAWAATVVSGSVTAAHDSTAIVSLSVRNEGERAWRTADRPVNIGTAAPRDSRSPLEHPAWLSPDRAATILEPTVPPGEVTTFEFPVAVPRGVTTAEFEIVAEGICWLPNTRFAVTVRGRHCSPLQASLRALQRRQGDVSRRVRQAVPDPVRTWLADRAR